MASNDGNPSGGMIRRAAGRVIKALSAPLVSFGWGEVRGGRRFVGDLVNSMRAEAPIDRRFQYYEDGSFDLEATSLLYGISVWELEKRLAKRQGQFSRRAHLWFGFGWCAFVAWIWRTATLHWTAGHILAAVEFAPFCLIFFLVAFQSALLNYQIRQRRLVSPWQYLRADDFWPR